MEHCNQQQSCFNDFVCQENTILRSVLDAQFPRTSLSVTGNLTRNYSLINLDNLKVIHMNEKEEEAGHLIF